jgi:cardiolipin synthase (CMP-forming)
MDTAAETSQLSTHRFLTAPNAFTLLRLCCVPLFFWLLFARDSRPGAALLLGGLGATDWVDGWIARRFNQVSEFGKIFDPTADRLMFISTMVGIIVDGAAPVWFCVLVIARELIFGAVVAVCTLFFGMQRFDVTWWGKTATFGLMFAIPSFMLGRSDIPAAWFFEWFGWIVGLASLALSYYVALAYVPTIRASLSAGRTPPPPSAP